MGRVHFALRMLVAATLVWGVLWALVAPAMAQGTPPPALATVTVSKLFCEDDERAGETEFQVGTAPDELDDELVAECTTTLDDGGEEPTFTLTNVDDDQGVSGQAVGGIIGFANVPAGTYTLTEESEAGEPVTSEPFPLADGDQLDITVINFVVGPPATVQVDKVFCADANREGEVDFFVQVDDEDLSAEAVAEDCRPADEGEASFTLSPHEGEPIGDPIDTDGEGTAEFEEVQPGEYVLTELESKAESDPFDVVNGEERPTTRVLVINYVAPEPTNTPTPTNTPDPTDAPKATKTPVSGSGGQTPKPTKTPTSGGGGGVVNPSVVTTRTPVTIATTPSRAVATTVSVSGVATRTTTSAVVRSSPISVTALPATGEGSVDVAPLSTITMMLLGALTLIALGISMFRRRAG